MHLMLVYLGEMPDEPLKRRILEVAPELAKLIAEHSRSHQHLHSTPSREVMMWALELNCPPWKLTNAFRGLPRTQPYDKCLLLELGKDHSDSGMNVATTWLTRNARG